MIIRDTIPSHPFTFFFRYPPTCVPSIGVLDISGKGLFYIIGIVYLGFIAWICQQLEDLFFALESHPEELTTQSDIGEMSPASVRVVDQGPEVASYSRQWDVP